MSKSNLKRLTFEELVNKKLEKDKNGVKVKDIEVPSLGGTLLFEKPTEEDVIECMDSIDSDGSMKDIADAYEILIYKCCPALKDTKLHEQFGIKVPTDIVKAMLELGEKMSIGDELMEFSGIKAVDKKIKK